MRIYREGQAANFEGLERQPRGQVDLLVDDIESTNALGHLPLNVEVKHYGDRAFAVYVNGELLAVTMYLKGSRAIEKLLNDLGRIALGERLGRIRAEQGERMAG